MTMSRFLRRSVPVVALLLLALLAPSASAGTPGVALPVFAAPPAPVAMFPAPARAAVWTNVPTDSPVAFITIDDGYPGADNPALADEIAAAQVPLTLFITYYAAASGSYPPSTDPVKVAHVQYLRKFLTGGRRVGSHAKSHNHLEALSYADQLSDLDKARGWLGRPDMFGASPVLFRPPYGSYDGDTLQAASALGHRVAVLWSLTPSDIAAGVPVRRGDIILLHFDASLEADLQGALDAIAAAGLAPAWLEDYIR